MLGIVQSTLLNMKGIKIILILVLIRIANLLKANVPDYVEHHVKLGDPWNVTCHTPFKEPTSWVFVSALPHYFNHYLYEEGKLKEYMDGRYNLTISDDKHTNTLQIKKSDENHAGQYVCIPDRTTLEHRQFHKLILVEYSNIKLIKYTDLNITLNMNISFLGGETHMPLFLCIFTYGTKEMSEIEKDSTGKLLKTYSFTKTYEPNEEVPRRCKILLKNGKPRLWNDTHLFIYPTSSDQNEHYIVNGSSWNMSCSTSSSYPMKWTFQGVMSNESNVTLYKYWKITDNYSSRYNFNFEPQTNTYTMMIPHVDVNHAGTYTCTHQSSDHLIEKILHLTVIDNPEIRLLYSPNLEEPTLTMYMTYVGPNTLQPQFSCLINKESYPMNKITFCGTNENYFESCFLSETFKYGAIIPDKCQIHFGTTMVKEHFLVVEQPFVKFFLFKLLSITFGVVIVILLVAIIALLIWYFKICKPQKTQSAPSNKYFTNVNELLNKTTELEANANIDVENNNYNSSLCENTEKESLLRHKNKFYSLQQNVFENDFTKKCKVQNQLGRRRCYSEGYENFKINKHDLNLIVYADKEQNLKDLKSFPHRGKSNLKNEELEVAFDVNKLKTYADKTKSKAKLETLIDVSTETIDTK